MTTEEFIQKLHEAASIISTLKYLSAKLDRLSNQGYRLRVSLHLSFSENLEDLDASERITNELRQNLLFHYKWRIDEEMAKLKALGLV